MLVRAKLSKYVWAANLFHSEENTHSALKLLKASQNPPMPANKSTNFICKQSCSNFEKDLVHDSAFMHSTCYRFQSNHSIAYIY